MLISEPTGLFLIPFASFLFQNAMDIIHQSGLFLVPFIAIIIRAICDARTSSQGTVVGAEMASFKEIEVKTYAGVVVLVLVLTPWRTGDFRYTQVACDTEFGFFLKGVNNVSDIAPQNPELSQIAKSSPSILLQAVHNIATLAQSTMSDRIGCQIDLNVRLSEVHLMSKAKMPPPLNQQIRQFHTQCYQPSRSILNDYIKTGKPLNGTLKDLSFFSPDMQKIYNGTIMIGMNLPIRAMENGRYCSIEAASVKSEIQKEIKSEEDAIIRKLIAGYRDTKTQPYNNLTDTEAKEKIEKDFIITSYANALSPPRNSGINNRSKFGENSSFYDMATSVLKSLGVTVGASVSQGIDTIKQAGILAVIPLAVTVIQSVIIVAFPILILFSGFSFQIITQIAILYFSVTTIPVALKIGLFFDRGLIAMITNSYDSAGTFEHATNSVLTNYVGIIFTYLVIFMWLLVLNMIGAQAAQTVKRFEGMSNANSKAGGGLIKGISKSAGLALQRKRGEQQDYDGNDSDK